MYVIGVDGGGTKTKAILANDRGEVLGEKEIGQSNYQIIGRENFKKTIIGLINDLIKDSRIEKGKISKVSLGLAGVGRENEKKDVQNILRDAGFYSIVENDAVIALIGALGGKSGVVIIAGTGSIALGKNESNEIARAGGWGYILGDEGSGFYIGKNALIYALKEYDGRGKKTILTEMIKQNLKISNTEEVIPMVYSGKLTRAGIADLAKLVFKAARTGDKIANVILDKAGNELGLLAYAVIKRLKFKSKEVDIGLVGGIFKEKEYLLEPIKSVIPYNINFKEPRFSPVVGALLMGLETINEDILGRLDFEVVKYKLWA
ncbi:MAG: BadF/BadG/BcrA/BcrD ATPase family protein [bacterium]|nr:BadF/BadG/BcrA/BcrD ATPase family protein [bacterium]